MTNIYKGHDRPESEFDPYETASVNDFDRDQPSRDRWGRNSTQKLPKLTHPFRDILDSMCTVVNRDLLFCKLFYFFFFGAFGSLFPLMSIYFKQLGMNASQSGLLIGFRPFIEFLSAPLWGGLADRWRRGKEHLLFSLLSWILFTLAIAFVQPPAHNCVIYNGTHTLLELPLGRKTREAAKYLSPVPNSNPSIQLNETSSMFKTTDSTAEVTSFANYPNIIYTSEASTGEPANTTRQASITFTSVFSLSATTRRPAPIDSVSSSESPSTRRPAPLHFISSTQPSNKEALVGPALQSLVYSYGQVYHSVDPSKIFNINASTIKGLLFNQHSVVVYQEAEVAHAFYILLLLVIAGEFFSSPAITFADSLTLSFLGDDVQNYGRQRMFGSLGWGLSMFFVGMALDHSTSFPDHPCGRAHIREKNYTVCFAVFCVLMSCAFLVALQFRFDHHSQDLKLSEVSRKVKNKVKRIVSGHRKIDRKRLVEEYSDDEDFQTHKSDDQEEQDKDNLDNEKNEDLATKPATVVGRDVVVDALKAPGAKPGRGFGGVTGAIPFGSAEASYSDQPFLGKWFSVMKLLATYQYLSVMFIAWFMGLGIGVIFTFLFWHLQDLGGSPTLFGVASVINHVSELLAFFMTGSLIAKYGHVKVLYAGLAGNVLRFMYISFLWNPWWVLPFEFVQGLTHAAVWAASCAYIVNAVPVELRSCAQSIIQGLHHGLGRGCGAVFGGLLVYRYGSVVTFRIYGVVCILVLAAYLGINYLLQDKGRFTHGSNMPHEMFEDTAHLAPHGVPSGTGRDLSSKRLAGQVQQEYGTVNQERKKSQGYKGPPSIESQKPDNPLHHGYEGDRIAVFEAPRLPVTTIKNKRVFDNYDDDDYTP